MKVPPDLSLPLRYVIHKTYKVRARLIIKSRSFAALAPHMLLLLTLITQCNEVLNKVFGYVLLLITSLSANTGEFMMHGLFFLLEHDCRLALHCEVSLLELGLIVLN